MTYRHHHYATLAMMYAFTGSFAATAIATASATLPDAMEIWRYASVRLPGLQGMLSPQQVVASSMISHRTYTHYPWFYLAAALPFYVRLQRDPGFVTYILYFMVVGCICHLFEDFLSRRGIPLITPKGRRFGLNLYQIRETSERYTAGGIVASCTILAALRGLLTMDYLMSEANRFSLLVFGFVNQLFRR